MSLNFSANFSGSNYLNVTNYTGNPAAFSVSHWLWPNADQLSRIFFANFLTGGSNKGWATGISDSTNNKIKFYLGTNQVNQTGTITSNIWTHAVCTWDGTTAKLYLNGNATPDATLTSGVVYGAVPTNNYIGTLDGSSQKWNGRLAGVGYWSKALSTGEVASLYNGGAGLAGADLSGSLLTSLGSYYDFLDSSSLGTDSSGNAHTYTNTSTVVQAYGPAPPFPAYQGRTQRPYRPVLQGRLSRGLVRAVIFVDQGAPSLDGSHKVIPDIARGDPDFYGVGVNPGAGSILYGFNGYGSCMTPTDSTGNGCVNLSVNTIGSGFVPPIAAGATEFTLSALASANTTVGGASGLRNLWNAGTATNNDAAVALLGGVLLFQVGSDGAFTNLAVDWPLPLNQPVLVTCRLTTAGVRSIWYGPVKIAERTDSGCAWGSNSGNLGLGSSAYYNTRNWSGQVSGGYVWNRALADSEIIGLAEDFFAPVRSSRPSISILSPGSSLGVLTRTEAHDTLAAAAVFLSPGAIARTEAHDTLVTPGGFSVSGHTGSSLSGTVTEGRDALVGIGALPSPGVLTATEAHDTLVAAAAFASPGSLARTGAADTLAALGTSAFSGSLIRTERPDLLVAPAVAGAFGSDTAGSTATGFRESSDSLGAFSLDSYALLAATERHDILRTAALLPPARRPRGNCRWFPGLNRRDWSEVDAGIGEG